MKLGFEMLPGQLYQRGLFHKLPMERKAQALETGNINTIVCLVKQPDPELAAWLDGRGGRYEYHPISDGKVVEMGYLELLAFDLAQTIRSGRAVMAVCRAGRNRSGLLSALVIREMTGCTGADAEQHVKRVRPNALYNPHFCAYLRGLDAPK